MAGGRNLAHVTAFHFRDLWVGQEHWTFIQLASRMQALHLFLEDNEALPANEFNCVLEDLLTCSFFMIPDVPELCS